MVQIVPIWLTITTAIAQLVIPERIVPLVSLLIVLQLQDKLKPKAKV